MQKDELTLFDMTLRIYHPPVLLDNHKYIAMVESLCDIYPTQRIETGAFEFSLSPGQAARVTPSMTSVSDMFEEDFRTTTRRVFHVLGRVLDVMEIERIETFDNTVSARTKPPWEPTAGFEDFTADKFIEKFFLKPLDFAALKAGENKPSPGVNWIFDMGTKGVSLKLEPFVDDRDYILLELAVQHPPGNISLGDIRAEVEQDLNYLTGEVVTFLRNAAELGK